MSEKEFYHWGIRFFTPNHVFPVDSEYNGPKTEKDAIEYLELFLLQAMEKSKQVDWSKITHLSLIWFSRDDPERYIIPVKELSTEDKILICLRNSINGYEPEDNTERILSFWIESRLCGQWHDCLQHNSKDVPVTYTGTFIELQYRRD